MKHNDCNRSSYRRRADESKTDIPLLVIYSISVEDTVGWWKASRSPLVSSTIGNMGSATATAAKATAKRLEKFILSVVGGIAPRDPGRLRMVESHGQFA